LTKKSFTQTTQMSLPKGPKGEGYFPQEFRRSPCGRDKGWHEAPGEGSARLVSVFMEALLRFAVRMKVTRVKLSCVQAETAYNR